MIRYVADKGICIVLRPLLKKVMISRHHLLYGGK